MQPITTAVIPIGGLGTRFYPAMKHGLKCLLPVYNRTVLDYLIDNCLEAGVTRLLLVGSNSGEQILRYVQEDVALRAELERRGKDTLYRDVIEPLHTRIAIQYIEQRDDTRKGPAAAVTHVRPYLAADESFVVMMGDDFLWRRRGSDLRDMIRAYTRTRSIAACLVERAKTFEAIQYNASVMTHGGPSEYYLDDIIEKPAHDTGSRFSSVGRYIFNLNVFSVIDGQRADPANGEFHLSETLRLLAQRGPTLVHVMKGRHLDCGVPEHWLATNNFIARQRR